MASTFMYKVKDHTGKIVTGAIEADNQGAVSAKLRSMGYIVLDIGEKKEAFSFSFKGFRKRVFSRQFATMINSGVAITRALSILSEQTENPMLGTVIGQLQKDVEGGLSLSEALAKQSAIFPPIFVNMARAGEAGGVLDEVLIRIADHFEREQTLRSRVKSSLSYPVALFSFSVLLVFVMITFIVPVFVNMFDTLGGELPLPTKMLLMASNFIRGQWYILLFGCAGSVYAWRTFKKRPQGRFIIDRVKLRLPVFGKLTQKISIAKFTRTLGTLVASGVPILQALDIVSETAENAVVTKAIRDARSSIKEGESISRPLSSHKVFPPMVVQMIAVGEETGALDSMLRKIADFYDEEVTAAVESLTSMLEPFMMLFMGLMIGGIVISLYMPMFNVVTLLSGQ